MRPRHPTAIALAASLACHATLIGSAMIFGVSERIAIAPRVVVELAPPLLPPDDPFGEREGPGEALNTLEAKQQLQSPHAAQDQPLLGLLPDGQLRYGPSASQMLALAEARPVLPTNQSLQSLSESLIRPRQDPPVEEGIEPAPAQTAPPVAAQAEQVEQTPTSPPTDPGAPRRREVDLFTKEAFADYRAGQAIAREGREFRIRGMRRGLAAYWDQAFLPRPVAVRFVIRVDAEGAPLEVRIEQSTGSEALDQAIRKELFNSWFDPDPSGTGADLGKPFKFTIRFL